MYCPHCSVKLDTQLDKLQEEFNKIKLEIMVLQYHLTNQIEQTKREREHVDRLRKAVTPVIQEIWRCWSDVRPEARTEIRLTDIKNIFEAWKETAP